MKDHFTNTEVMSMFESLKSDISVLAEGQQDLRSDVKILKTDMVEVKDRLTTIEDVLRANVFPRLTRLETKVFG